MADVNFSQWIETFAQRVRTHRRHINLDDLPPLDRNTSLNDLQTAQEELSAAEEELRMQNEQLRATLDEAQAERQRYRELFEFSHDGCIVTDLKGIIVEANHAAAQMLHMPAQFLPGKPLIRCLDAESHGVFRAELRQIQQTHGSSEVRVRVQPRAAASFYASLTLTAMVGKDQHLQGVRWLLRDVTAEVKAQQDAQALQEQAQQQLRNHALQLEDICRSKDQMLEREHNARLKAEAAVAARDKLLANAAHELRTPLTPILASVETLQKDPALPPALRPTLDLIGRNVNLQARLIEGLWEMARIGCGKLVLHLHPLDLHGLLKDVLDVCQHEIAAKALEVIVQLDATEHTVSGDIVRLQQVYWNIIKNAVKFSHRGGRLVITTDNAIADRIRVQVTDTGIGIAPAMLSKIFDAFEQGDNDIMRKFDGLGLGLMISKTIVEAHGGTITAHSEGKGHGATFMVDLPLTSGAAQMPDLMSENAGTRRSASILLVDDHHDTLVALARALRQAGHVVQTADALAQAMHALESQVFDVLITDLSLPDGCGTDLLPLAEKRHVAAITLSGAEFPADPDPASPAGIVGPVARFTKPIDFAALEKAVQDTLR